jgi:alanyl-tRNA synthetase
MNNNYFSQVAPYMQSMNPQEQQGLMPVFQNIGAQQANQNAAMQQGQALTQAASQIGKEGGGNNQMALAKMLRKGNTPAPVTDYSQAMPNYMDPAYQQAGY